MTEDGTNGDSVDAICADSSGGSFDRNLSGGLHHLSRVPASHSVHLLLFQVRLTLHYRPLASSGESKIILIIMR